MKIQIQSKSARTCISADGAIQFTMLPFRNMLTNILISDTEILTGKPSTEWKDNELLVCLMLGVTLNVVCLDDENPEAQSVADFWDTSDGKTTAEKWQLFQVMVSPDVIIQWWTAYKETRRVLPSASDLLAGGEPNDPNSDGSGGIHTKPKS